MTTISPVRPLSPTIGAQPNGVPARYASPGSTSTVSRSAYSLAGNPAKQSPAKKSANSSGPLDQFINPQPSKPGDPRLEFGKDGGWKTIPGTKRTSPKGEQGNTSPRPITPDEALKKVTDNVNPANRPIRRTPAQAIVQKSNPKPDAVNANYKLTMRLPGDRVVQVKARNDGSLLMVIPDQFDLNGKSASLNMKGVNKNSSRPEIQEAVEKLCRNVDLVPYVYDVNGRALYNDGGAGSSNEIRLGKGWIFAHAGDRKAKPADFPEHNWENGDDAIASARAKGTIPEIDIRYNINSELVRAHDPSVEQLDKKGKVNVETDSLKDVQKVAGTLRDMLAKFPPTNDGRPSFVLEMKKGVASPDVMAKALYKELKTAGRLKDVIITSMHSEMLTAMYNLAKKDRIPLKLMKILGLHQTLDRGYIDDLKESTPYIRSVGFPINGTGLTTKDSVDYAKKQGLFVGGWNWDPFDNVRLAKWSNRRIDNLDLDYNITDDINDAKSIRSGRWK